MSLSTPRLRMFAGPNGSGKSTIKNIINKELLGVYINPDDIESSIKEVGYLDFDNFEIKTSEKEILTFLDSSTLLKLVDLQNKLSDIKQIDNKLIFTNTKINSYFASVCADFIRRKLLEDKKSFTFETVMSSYDKIELLKLSKSLGYRNYLYYIATRDPLINISRVKNRVAFKGHNVPEDKIKTRYYRSLNLLREAVKLSDRAYIFDNSSDEKTWICEITDGSQVDIKVDHLPNWVEQYLLQHNTSKG